MSKKDVDALLKKFDPPVRRTALELRALITKAVPDAVEKVHTGWKVIGYSFGGGMKDGICAIAPHKGHVNLQLMRGTELEDPKGLLEGSGKTARHVKIDAGGKIVAAPLRSLIKKSAKLAQG